MSDIRFIKLPGRKKQKYLIEFFSEEAIGNFYNNYRL